MKKILFSADKITIRGPKIDGGYVISFETGEYSQNEVAEILKIPQNTPIGVMVEYENQ